MMDYNHWFAPTNPKAQEMKRKVEATGTLFTFEVYLAYNAVKLIADALERAGSADKEKLTAALASSTWADHFMPYGPTRFVDGQKFNAVHVKVVTEAGNVYLLGMVSRKEADDATEIARTTSGVQKVVRLFEFID
jgi:branched-chain amino acid transport system substrate-binding protein